LTCEIADNDQGKSSNTPVFLPRSIVSLTDHLPISITSSGSVFFVGRGSASAKLEHGSNSDVFCTGGEDFFASALLSAICSRMLMGDLGARGSSLCGVVARAGDFELDDAGFGVDFVRRRVAGTLRLVVSGDSALNFVEVGVLADAEGGRGDAEECGLDIDLLWRENATPGFKQPSGSLML
jgi:hypothetical protein